MSSPITSVIDETFELFANLGANDRQLDFPVIYASAIKGFATVNPLVQQKDMKELLSIIVGLLRRIAQATPANCDDPEDAESGECFREHFGLLIRS